jgi:hypothetical protein
MRLKNMRGLVRSAIILLSLSATNVIFGSIIWQCPDAGMVIPRQDTSSKPWQTPQPSPLRPPMQRFSPPRPFPPPRPQCLYQATMASNIPSRPTVSLSGGNGCAKISAFHGRATWLTPGSHVSCQYSLNGGQEFGLSISSNDTNAGQPANKDCKLIGGTLINPNTCYGPNCAVSCPDN